MSFVSNKFTSLLCSVGAAALLAACPDSGESPDARIPTDFDANTGPDAATIDAGPDAAIDAAPTTYSGTIAVQEISIANLPQLGQGIQISTSFEASTAPQPVFEEMPGSLFGCKVWELTAAQAAVPTLNEGTVTIAATDGDPVLPPCNFSPAANLYVCPSAGGTGGAFGPSGMAGVFTFTDAEAGFNAATIGNYLFITGSTDGTFDGRHPILQMVNATTVAFGANLPAIVAPVPHPAAGTYTALAGIGPIPGTADPGFIEDDDTVSITLTTGGAGDIPTFTAMNIAAGDDFTLSTTAPETSIIAIPTDGSAFSLGCATGCGAGSAFGSVIVITTADGATLPALPSMPAVVTKEVTIRCAKSGNTPVTIPAAVSAYLMTSGATRIQTTFVRAGLGSGGVVTPVVGHGIVGFTTP